MLAGLPMVAIYYALLEWSRSAELSCDRAAALVTRDPQAVCRALMVITAGEAAEHLSLDAFIAQGMDYDDVSGTAKLTRMMQDLNVTHPLPVRRVRHLLDWVQGGEYEAMIGGEYLRRGQEPTASEEAATARDHYSDRISDAVQEAGSTVADVGQQLGDWLRKQRGDGGSSALEAVGPADVAVVRGAHVVGLRRLAAAPRWSPSAAGSASCRPAA